MGDPYNIVHTQAFLDRLRDKLDATQCIFCERTFPDASTLRKHMRKKKHFQVNPRNNFYDRFYMQNYTQYHQQEESDDEEEDFEDWNEENESTMCLFDEMIFDTPEAAHDHLKERHQFDLAQVADFYMRIRLINYIRTCFHDCKCHQCNESFSATELLVKHYTDRHTTLPPSDHFAWTDARFLFPFNENDGLLMLELDD